MRTATAAPVTSLLGSLALHACAVLALFVAARRPVELPSAERERPDAWRGNAVEVDAIATPEGTPNIANAADSPAESVANSAPVAVEAPVPASPTPPVVAGEPRPTRTSPQPRPKTPAKPAATPSAASDNVATSAAETGASHEATSAAATGAFGAEGLPIGVRSLPSAFTRAIPPATGADPIWQTLPVGTQRPFTLMVRIDATGHIDGAQVLESHAGQGTSPQFEHLRERVIALLGGGLFALQNNAVAGTDLFRITITLSDRAVQDESAPAELVERGFEPPRGKGPGRAYFTLASGRHFEAKVEVLGAPARANHP